MEKTYRMKNLDCANCASKIERAIKKIDGVDDVNISFMTQRLTLKADESRLPEIVTEMQRLADKIEPGTQIVG